MNWTLTLAASLLFLTGCSPALNWRNVPVADAALTITLPCKPDQANRKIELAGVPVELFMVGCDADGATFAVSHVALDDPSTAGAALAHWRAAALAQLGPAAAASAVDTPYAPAGVLPLAQSVRTVATGQRADGTAVTLQAVWFARVAGPKLRLYHAVVYTAKPRPAVAEAFFAGLSLQ